MIIVLKAPKLCFLQNVEETACPRKIADEESRRNETSTKAARVNALAVNIDHWKKYACSQHKCQVCERPLNQQELDVFLKRQVWMDVPLVTIDMDLLFI